MMVSVKHVRKQMREETPISLKVRMWFDGRQVVPLLVKDGVRARNATTVPVGRRLARLATVARVLWTGWPESGGHGGAVDRDGSAIVGEN